MKLFAFQGTRYDPEDRDPGRLAVAPFDQIGPRLAAELRQDPHSFAHLTRPDPASDDPHQLAAETQAAWLEQGIVVQDDEPSLYLYETRLVTGGTRLGLCGLIGLGASPIQPHEKTVSRIVDERLELLTATATDLEPIFLLSNDPGSLNEELEADYEDARWLASHLDGFGHLHSIAPISDPDRIERYKDVLEGQTGLIADGHHRFKVAVLHAEKKKAKAGTAAACKLVVVVSLSSPHLTIDPIHRALAEPVDLELLRPWVRGAEPWRGETGSGLALSVATARQPAVGVWKAGDDPELWTLDLEAILQRASAPTPELSVALLDVLLPELGLSEAVATDGTVSYRSDPDQLYSEMRSSRFDASFWLPPISPEQFSDALEVTDLLPPKSTRFLPKLASGLVWAQHSANLL
jgi:uncharacterized protein (DUF1015 family)